MIKALVVWFLTTLAITLIFFLREAINLRYIFMSIAFLGVGAMVLTVFVL